MEIPFKKIIYIGLVLLFSLFLADTAYAATYGNVTGSVVNVRSHPEICDSNQLFQVPRGTSVEITGAAGDFFRTNVNGYYDVYISRDWVNISTTTGTLHYGIAFIYNAPREHGGYSINRFDTPRNITVTASYGDWFAMDNNGETAFVEKFFVSVPYFVELPTARIPRLPGQATLGDDIVAFAMQYLGTRYVYGGMSPAGFDCSGFMNYILRNFDISINRVSRDIATNGEHVARANLQPADLVFFSSNPGGSRITHVGMYIGGGEFIHSSTWNSGVRISSMYSNYNNPRFVTARRVI